MLPAPGDGADRDGLVFVSYSHADAAWAERFRVLLKPLVLRKHLRLWDDTSIRVGEEWHPAIERAIERSRVALLLVSADFLASDYIMQRELPALRSNGVVLAPALVADCLWRKVPEVAAVQWLHDVDRDGALSLHTDRPGERDRWIRYACERLLTVAPDPVPDDAVTSATAPPTRAARRIGWWRRRRHTVDSSAPGSHPAPHSRPGVPGSARDGAPAHGLPRSTAPPVVAELPEADRRGALSRVPALPPSYVVRDELDELVDVVVGASGGGAVGLTGPPAGVGLHGLGGIGKSVLATAVAADDQIRRRFPDGIYWVTVGERPDLLALQLDLLARLGVRAAARTPTEATAALRAALADQRVLLVVDDVWSDAAAQAFRVMGPRGRLLYTSRDQGVIRAAGAVAHQVGVLSPAAARALAASVLATPAASLPITADQAFEAVGRVPLAVGLLAAAVRAGRPWTEVAADLARDADVYGAHPYADTFRALHIATTALPTDLRAALVGLAVFPPDIAIPVAAIGRYWAHTRNRTSTETGDDLDRLAAAKVLQRDRDTDGVDTAGFHDLAHEYLLLQADGLPALHAQLLQAYGRLLNDGEQWWQLPPDEPYIGEHLAAHLAGAGERLTLARTVTDPAYQAQRIARDGPHAGEADLTLAARLRPNETVIAWWRAWLARHTHLLSRAAAGAPDTRRPRVASTMLAWLTADPARPSEVEPARLAPLLPRPYVAVSGGLDAPSPALVRVLTGHTGAVRAVAWSADGTQLVTAGHDRTLRSWNPDTGENLRTHGKFPRGADIAWSRDGTRLATRGKEIRIWNPATGKVVHTLPHRGVDAVAWSPDGSSLVTVGQGTVRTWSPTSGEAEITPKGWTGNVSAVAWSADGTQLAFLASSAEQASVQIAKAIAGSRLRTVIDGMLPTLPWSKHSNRLAWSAYGNRLAAGGWNGTVYIWDPAARRVHNLEGHTAGVNAAAWSPDGAQLGSAGIDGTVRIWNVMGSGGAAVLHGHVDAVNALSWSPDGTRLATASDDKNVHIWDPRAAGPAAKGKVRTDAVHALTWSPDGTRLASAFAGNATVHLWNPTTDERVSKLSGDEDILTILAVAWSPDGTRLAVASEDDTVAIWKVKAGRRVGTLKGHKDWVRAAAWSPDGTRLATGSDDRTVRLWDPITGRPTATLQGHAAEVRAVAWSPDAQLATASDDKTVRLWDPTGTHTATLEGHTDEVTGVAWSRDGAHLASVDAGGLLIIWDATGRQVSSLVLQPSECLAWSAETIAVGQPGRPAFLTLRDPADLVS